MARRPTTDAGPPSIVTITMRLAALFLVSAAVIAPASSARAELACADLESPRLDQCLKQQAIVSSRKLESALKRARSAGDDACSAVPSPAIGACLEKAQDTADRSLERELKAAMSSIDREAASPREARSWKTQLQASQKAWAAFKDADCGGLVALEWMHGTGAGSASQQCTLEKTLTRSEDLRARYRER